MITSGEINELATALAAAQGEFGPVQRRGLNTYTQTTYATLTDMLEACRGALAKHGLCIVQTPEFSDDPGRVALTTRLLHTSGQWIESLCVVPVARQEKMAEIHSYVSALTYARRCSLAAILGIAPDADDDGNAAAGKTTSRASQRAAVEETTAATEAQKEAIRALCRRLQKDADQTILQEYGCRIEDLRQAQASRVIKALNHSSQPSPARNAA
jgi:hypothetical protein